MERCCRPGQATDDHIAHVHCMLYTKGYMHTLRICNTYHLLTAAMVAGTRPIFTSNVHRLAFVCSPSYRYPLLLDRHSFRGVLPCVRVCVIVSNPETSTLRSPIQRNLCSVSRCCSLPSLQPHSQRDGTPYKSSIASIPHTLNPK